MLFNSYIFIFVFLPVTLLVFFRIGALGHHRVAIAWLVAASLFFYGWWNPAYLGLILSSMLFNYALGVALSGRGGYRALTKAATLALGVCANLGLLGYFKYANFFVDNVSALSGLDLHIAPIVLPLAISFFTFQQIAYLVDAYRGETQEYNFLHYCLFVVFFPQLIAGPIVHHGEMLPQFARDSIYRFRRSHFAVGVTIFALGLFKKVVLADGIAPYATPVFNSAAQGVALSFADAWGGALAYTFQLYFDFSGYSDMAIGLARMFGIRLPLNFNSPYKAVSIVDFWRRWHMTLSRFLRDYLYIPLGGNRRGAAHRYLNLLVTMLLGGLWHGAGWTFVIWGALHGAYLIINHGWTALRQGLGISARGGLYRAFARSVTFFAVVVAWVFFRAPDVNAAWNMLRGMAGVNGFAPALPLPGGAWAVAALGLILVWSFPNTQQIVARYRPALETYPGELAPARWRALRWRPTYWWVAVTTTVTVVSVLQLNQVSEFLYFQF